MNYAYFAVLAAANLAAILAFAYGSRDEKPRRFALRAAIALVVVGVAVALMYPASLTVAFASVADAPPLPQHAL